MPGLAHALREQGLYTFVKWNWIFVVPPLCISAEQIAEGLDVIDNALELADAALPGAQ
jgi:taurine--2-oxoglutarate transaminase